ncbi:sensor histidine kinase [Enterovibrio norvegicus]|uniref:histidine kinase n=1 Tax=Enterovibrio norvegicus DSM 15893 TaxID=1121869 RepID=A0A1I5WW56_9GAMM|nr:HAMP domain-containing sensor histidine kinase [Enterovibrio norvegicus]SFQ23756.1 Signal transduction histidine kinase [Enterovibrio norvegicus DSM 15893]
MSKIKSAKQLTFTYFSIVAFAIITIHFSVLESTVENLEHFTAQYRLESLANSLNEADINSDIVVLDNFSTAYIGYGALPDSLEISKQLALNSAVEIYKAGRVDQETDYFVMKTTVMVNGEMLDAYIVNNDPIFELSEEKTLKSQANQLLLSFGLLILSLLVVLKIASRLTKPYSSLANQLSAKTEGDLSPLTLPAAGKTVELVTLTESINTYQSQIADMLERERAFNRFASHELRTPLMVLRGSLSLLEHANDPQFVDKQRVRMTTAVEAMQDYVETLLSLTREKEDAVTPWRLNSAEIETLLSHFQMLLEEKNIEVLVNVEHAPCLRVSHKAVGILVGNLIKNAFVYTEQGQITIHVSSNAIVIQDTGVGLESNSKVNQGYGLGLVIAQDIARKYGWQIDLKENDAGGCTASVTGLENEGLK